MPREEKRKLTRLIGALRRSALRDEPGLKIHVYGIHQGWLQQLA